MHKVSGGAALAPSGDREVRPLCRSNASKCQGPSHHAHLCTARPMGGWGRPSFLRQDRPLRTDCKPLCKQTDDLEVKSKSPRVQWRLSSVSPTVSVLLDPVQKSISVGRRDVADRFEAPVVESVDPLESGGPSMSSMFFQGPFAELLRSCRARRCFGERVVVGIPPVCDRGDCSSPW